MKILTANIALGNPRADNLLGALRSLIKFHNWRVIPFLIFGGRFGNILDYGCYPQHGRTEWFKAHSSLKRTIDLIAKEKPDVLVLNELIYQTHYEELNAALADLGYSSVVWGQSPHQLDATICTVVASRLPMVNAAPLELPWSRQVGGGGGAAYLRLRDMPIIVIGCHLAIGKGVREVFEKEIAALRDFAESEQKQGRQVIIAGDFNAIEAVIQKIPGFSKLGLRSVTNQKTCPTCLPWIFRTGCDHVFVPAKWQVTARDFPSFGSDHLAVVTEVKPA
jgi:endonuclease/exonuclease/phosphatase family metal-dependent hydrolase